MGFFREKQIGLETGSMAQEEIAAPVTTQTTAPPATILQPSAQSPLLNIVHVIAAIAVLAGGGFGPDAGGSRGRTRRCLRSTTNHSISPSLSLLIWATLHGMLRTQSRPGLGLVRSSPLTRAWKRGGSGDVLLPAVQPGPA